MVKSKRVNKRRRSRVRFLFVIFFISILSLIFIVENFKDNIVFFYAPSDILKQEVISKINDRQIRVGGLVKLGSIRKIDAITTIFVISDLENELEIFYQGILPDLFRQEQGVVAKGKMDFVKNRFIASELLIRHDENYMPPEVENSLKR